jgi:membrane-associated phospholipid phosphatase
MKVLKQYIAPSIFMIIFLIMGSLYPTFNTDIRGSYSLVTALDNAVPFVKEFIIPYIAWYPFIFLGLLYFCFKDRDIYYKVLISLTIGVIISYGIYFTFQTTVPRPELVGDDFFTKLISVIYKRDKPFNCLPSLHVLETYLMIKGIQFSSAKNRLNSFIITFIGSLIIISTQLIKQHILLDLVSSIILAELIFKLVYKLDLHKSAAIIKDFITDLFPNNETENYKLK